MIISGYRAMWLFVMFDLPVTTKKERKAAARFRKDLLDDGFRMMQYSVYIRPCPSEENTEVHYSRMKTCIPDQGEVRIIKITDKQFSRMDCFYGKISKKLESQPRQLELF
jgi:CRISPR-associated protein Cas2